MTGLTEQIIQQDSTRHWQKSTCIHITSLDDYIQHGQYKTYDEWRLWKSEAQSAFFEPCWMVGPHSATQTLIALNLTRNVGQNLFLNFVNEVDMMLWLPVSSLCSSETLLGAWIIGTLPTSPLVTPSSRENNIGYPSPGIRGLALGVAHSSSRGTNNVRSHANTISCVRDQSYDTDANTC